MSLNSTFINTIDIILSEVRSEKIDVWMKLELEYSRALAFFA